MVRPKIFILLTLLISVPLKAQISEGGVPASFNAIKLKSAIEEVFVRPPDLNQIQAEDQINDSLGRPFRIAYMIPVDICQEYSGKWDTLSSGVIIWRVRISSPGALGLQLLYNNFYIPKDGKLFLYSEDKKFVIGAFTEQNNHSSRLFATEIIPGESVILEYVKGPTQEQPSICISKVGYVYRGMASLLNSTKNLKVADACEVNVRCSPEGDNWSDVKRSVLKLIMNGFLCTGTLLNNTAQDFRNFLCTAFHCIEGQEAFAPQYLFYFNYERTSCLNTSPPAEFRTLTGAEIRAAVPLKNGSDGVILELNGTIPLSYNPYWAGWDINEADIAGGAGIHHPDGDFKKISTVRSYWTTETWFGEDTVQGAKGAHWAVVFAQTPNGHGVTEPGSSGSGIFSPDGLFHGQLSGGSSSCTDLSGDNLYGKISYSWDKYSAAPNQQFKRWLDPQNTGLKRLKGTDKNQQSGIFWNSSAPVIELGSQVFFSDESDFNPVSWSWTFEGGTPSSSTQANPVVTYTNPGLYNVSLTIVNDKGTFALSRTNYVYVKPKSAWIVQNSRFEQPSRGIDGFSIVDSLTVWAWAFDGLNPDNPILEYTRTTDGGKNWKADSVTQINFRGYGMSNMVALGKDTAFAAIFGPDGGGNIIRTTDAGSSWQIQSSATFSAPNGFPNFVYFFNKQEGVCVGDPNNGFYEIYTTTNSGINWNRVGQGSIPAHAVGETGTVNMYDAKGDTIWFGSSNGRVYRSINKGRAWEMFRSGLIGRINVRFKNAKVGFAFQMKQEDLPFSIRKTSDGGNTWSSQTIATDMKQGDLTFVPGTKASWVSVSSGRSSSGSSYSLNDANNFTIIDNEIQYTAIKFLNPIYGWAGGFNRDSFNGGIYKWNKLYPLISTADDPIPGSDKDKLFILEPVPAIKNLSVVSRLPVSGTIKISMVNIQGKLIDSFTYKDYQGLFDVDLNLGNYGAGVYMIIIQYGTSSETHKIVVLKTK